MSANQIVGVISILLGLGMCALSYVTWGHYGHIFAPPYKSFALIGAVLLAAGVWGLRS